MAGFINTTSEVSGSGTVTGFAGNKNEGEGSRFEDDGRYFEKAEKYGENVRINAGMSCAGINEIRLEVTIPKEAVVGLIVRQ